MEVEWVGLPVGYCAHGSCCIKGMLVGSCWFYELERILVPRKKPAFPLKKQPPEQPVCEARKEQIHDSLLS